MHPLSLVVEPEEGNPLEVEGVLNPAVVRGPDDQLYLFPRIVGAGNFSRIGIMRVLFDHDGEPTGVERLGVALEPEMPYELRPDGGGCEDPRITYVAPLKHYVMTYTAFSPVGPRIALAVSKDLLSWRRLGLASFAPYEGIEFQGVDNKDAACFPVAIPNPWGEHGLAMLHRPLFPGTRPEEIIGLDEDREVDTYRESIWISYSCMPCAGLDPDGLCCFTSHHRLAAPMWPWENLKIGSGTPPVLTRHGWLIVHHGVSDVGVDPEENRLTYSAGVMMLSMEHPKKLLYRSSEPALTPVPSQQRRGTLADVVFPTGIDRRDDIGQPDRYDVYYGMNDFRIGVARLDVPPSLHDDATPEPDAQRP
jgi:predicted GH43/DUF377 family glycosyl hydrolase